MLFQQHGAECGEVGRALLQPDDIAHDFQVLVKIAVQAADHGVGIAHLYSQRCNHGVVAIDGRFGRLKRQAFAPHQLVVFFCIAPVVGVVARVDDADIFAHAQVQPQLADAALNDIGATNQERAGNAFVQRHLRRAQHAGFFPFGVHHALGQIRRIFGGLKHRPHE